MDEEKGEERNRRANESFDGLFKHTLNRMMVNLEGSTKRGG